MTRRRFLLACLLGLLWTSPAWAVITQNSLDHGFTGTAATSFTTNSVPPGANRLIVISITSHDSASGVPSDPTVTGNGITYAKIVGGQFFNGGFGSWVYRGMSAAPSAGVITINFGNTDQQDFVIWSVMEFIGVSTSGSNGSGAVGLFGASNNNVGTTQSVNLGSLTAGSATYGLLYAHDQINEISAGSGYTLVHSDTDAATTTQATEWKQSGTSTVDMSNGSSVTLGVFGVEIIASGGVSTPVRHKSTSY